MNDDTASLNNSSEHVTEKSRVIHKVTSTQRNSLRLLIAFHVNNGV